MLVWQLIDLEKVRTDNWTDLRDLEIKLWMVGQ